MVQTETRKSFACLSFALLYYSRPGTIKLSAAFQPRPLTSSRLGHRGLFQNSVELNMKDEKWIVRSLTHVSEPENTTVERLPTRLVLHLDINETILLGDNAGGDSRHDSVQKMLAKSSFCQLPSKDSSSWDSTQEAEPTHWWDGQKINEETSIPPLYTGWEWPNGCCPYYRTKYKRFSKQFVEGHGKVYRPILDECEKELAKSGQDHILPAFYQTLHYLIKLYNNNMPFTLVFRTFGSDIDEIAQVLTKFAAETNCPALELSPNKLYRGRWKEEKDGSTVYQLWNRNETELIASGDKEILNLLREGSVFGITDDYNFWRNNDWLPTAGKPIWIPKCQDESSSIYDHHIFFDDNIHNLEDDGIACVRKEQADGTFVTLNGASMHQESQGVHLIRVPTIEPVLNPNWFVEKIQSAQTRLQERLK